MRLGVLTHRELDIPSPGVIGLDVGQILHIDGVGDLELAHLEDPAAGPVASPSAAGRRAAIFLEFRPL